MRNRDGQSSAKSFPDLHTEGREKFAASSLATFNKKVWDMAEGRVVVVETDDIPVPNFGDEEDREAADETEENEFKN